jgi:hypothetical protein
LCLVLATFAGACGPSKTPVPRDDSALTAAADFRVLIERLVREHVYLAAIMTEAAATRRTREFEGAASAFDDNGIAFAQQLAAQYGEATQRAFLVLWRRYQPLLVGYAARLVNKKPTALVLVRINALPGAYGALMASIAPLINPHTAARQMMDVVAQIKSFIGSQAKRDFAKADSTVRSAGAKAGLLGAAVAMAMIEDHPAVFWGDPNAPAAVFRYTLSASLAENVYLLSLATQESATHRAAELKGATAALQASSKQLVSHLGSMYGSGFAKTFTPLWERRNTLFLNYAAAGNDKAKKKKAVADLKQHAMDLATFFAGANKDLDEKEMAQLLSDLVSAQLAVVDAQLAGDFDKAVVAIRSAAQATEGLGTSLTQATVLKYPSKFRPAPRSTRTPSG